MKVLQHSIIILIVLFAIKTFGQTTYYVDQTNGDDNTNNGQSLGAAYQTFDKALGKVKNANAGTIIIVGEYSNPSYNPNYTYPTTGTAKEKAADAHVWHAENTLKISSVHGTSSSYITIKGYNANTLIKGDGANIIRVQNSSYLKFEGLTIEGEADRIPLSTSLALQFAYVLSSIVDTTNPTEADINFRNEEDADGDHIVEDTDTYPSLGNVVRSSYIDTRGAYFSGCNDIEFTNNTIHHTPGGGLRFASSKNVLIQNNEIYKCSGRSYSGTHALVVTKSEPIATDDYSIRIIKNNIHHNYNEMFSWAPSKTIITPRIDEGKGISLQRNNISSWVNGQGRILAENNLAYWNGFSGVHSNDGNRIDFINNTVFMNSYTNTITYAGQAQSGGNIGISNGGSGDDIKYINNISVADIDWTGKALASTSNYTNLVVRNNIIYGISGSNGTSGTISKDPDVTAVEVNTTEANPLFVDAPSTYQDETYTFDFNLQSNSPAIDNADVAFAPTDDYFSIPRDATPDIGAIEYSATAGVDDENISNVRVFPNPFTDKILIKGIELTVDDIQLFNMLGQNLSHLISIDIGFETSINTSRLNSGTYILRVKKKASILIKK